MRWFTADLHLGHQNVLKYCNRPFANVDEMNEALIHNWNSVVTSNDTTYVLGDFAMGSIKDTLPLVSQLNGTKVLIPGNHDRCWSGIQQSDTKRTSWILKYLDAGFDHIVEYQSSYNHISIGDTYGVKLNHFPYVGDSQDEDRYVSHRPVDKGYWLLHGHVHDAWVVRGRMINVGVDVHDYFPVSEELILAYINASNLLRN